MKEQMTRSDAELLRLVANDDENAFTELYRRYKDKLYGFALHLSRSEEEAKDLVHEVFSKIWEKRNTLKNKELFGSYLYKMIRNFSMDHLRRFSLKTAVLDQLDKNSVTAFSADSDVICKEIEQKMEAGIAQLPNRQREIYRLHRDKGLKYTEIAQLLGLSVSTVENHFSRALDNIRKNILSDYEVYGLIVALLILLPA